MYITDDWLGEEYTAKTHLLHVHVHAHLHVHTCAIIIALLYIEALSFVCESTAKLVNHKNTEN